MNFLVLLYIKWFEFVRHFWERFAFRFLKVSCIIYDYGEGKRSSQTKLYLKDGIIHTIEGFTANISNESNSIGLPE
jgi:hypothetical protein